MKYILLAVVLTATSALAIDFDVTLEAGKVSTDLQTPDYPNVHSGSSEPIIWKFSSETDTKIEIKCTDFRLSETEDCQSIRLEVDTGDDKKSYCGAPDNFLITSTSNVITLKLEGDEYGQAAFSCYAKSTKAPEAEVVELKLNQIQTLSSPTKDGEKGSPFYDKVWLLKAEEGYQVDLNCYTNLMEDSPCYNDVLSIDVGDGVQEFCGFNNEVLFSKGSEATVRLQLGAYGDGTMYCVTQAVMIKDSEISTDAEMPADETRTRLAVEDSREHGMTSGRVETTCPCGWANKPNSNVRIIRGNEAYPNEYPWMVGLRAHFGRQYAACGASLVTHHHVITAAHCLINLGGDRRAVLPEDLFVIVGAHHLGQFLPRKSYREYRTERHFIRPEFPAQLTHDFAVVVVKEKIEFSKVVGPICLSPTSIQESNKMITIMGWGKTESAAGSQTLLKAKTHVTNLCRKQPWEACTRTDPSATCSGDSGGPMVWLDPETNRYTQMSLVSYGHPDCVSSPTVSTDVSYFYKWLLDIIKATYPDEVTCVKKKK